MGKVILDYQNVTTEDINQVCFVNGNSKQIYIIHEFGKGKIIDYIVIGKISEEYNSYMDISFAKWIVLTGQLIRNYKSDLVNKDGLRNYNYNKFFEHEMTKKILFTKEGYDLITNKFLYTNYQLERSVNLDVVIRNNKIRYDIGAHINKFNQDEHNLFMPIEKLENEYFFSDSQLSTVKECDFVKYAENNKNKIIKLLWSERRFIDEFQKLDNENKKINYLMQIISIKEREVEEKSRVKVYK